MLAQSYKKEFFSKLAILLITIMPLTPFLGIAICNIFIYFLAIAFLTRSLIFNNWRWVKQTWVIAGLILWAYVVMQSPFAIMSPKLAFSQALGFGRFVLFAAAIQDWLITSQKNHDLLIKSLIYTVVFITINTIFTFITGITLLGQNGLSIRAHHHVEIVWAWDRSFSRLLGINGKQNPGILLSWISLPVVMHFLTTRSKQYNLKNIMRFIAILLIALAVLITGERTALLELGLGLIILFISIKQIRKPLFIAGISCLLVLIGMLAINHGLYHRQFSNIVGSVDHFKSTPYGGILRASIAIFKDHPIFGIGLKQYHLLSSSPQYIALGGKNMSAQNIYLEWLTGTGIIGTSLFLIIMGSWIKTFWSQRKLLLAYPIAFAILTAWIQRIWPIASTTSIYFSWGGITFWWMGAWCLSYLKIVKTKETQQL